MVLLFVVFVSLFCAIPIVCVFLCLDLVVQYLMSFLVLQSSHSERERESLLFLFNCYSISVHRSVLSWSAVCVCVVSWSYSLTFRTGLPL